MSARPSTTFPATPTKQSNERLRDLLALTDDLTAPLETVPVDVASDTNKHPRIFIYRVSGTAEAVALKFNRLASQWREETGHMSSVNDICTNNKYQEIISMGKTAAPYILRELEAQPAYWFWALTAITGASPVPTAFQGTYAEAVQLWLDWARENEYEW